MTILLDTNIVIEHLKNGMLEKAPNDYDFAVSVITEAELFCLSGMEEKENQVIEKFLAGIKILGIDSKIARKAALLRRTKKGKLPDLLIAATAIEYDLMLITKNTKDFRGIKNLRIQKTI